MNLLLFTNFISIKVIKGRDVPHSKRHVVLLLVLVALMIVILTLLLWIRANTSVS